jgi:uncharacterized membrane protein
VVIEIRSCCPECVVAVFYDLFVGNLSTIILVILGVRALTKEEQLYIRLCRVGKYFSTREEICT